MEVSSLIELDRIKCGKSMIARDVGPKELLCLKCGKSMIARDVGLLELGSC